MTINYSNNPFNGGLFATYCSKDCPGYGICHLCVEDIDDKDLTEEGYRIKHKEFIALSEAMAKAYQEGR